MSTLSEWTSKLEAKLPVVEGSEPKHYSMRECTVDFLAGCSVVEFDEFDDTIPAEFLSLFEGKPYV